MFDRTQFKAVITDYDAFPEMSDEEHELWLEDLAQVDELSEFKATMARIGVLVEPKDLRELTTDGPGMYDTVN